MSREDAFRDHVQHQRRTADAGIDSFGHPCDTFAVIGDFWCDIFQMTSRVSRAAQGIVDLPPWEMDYPLDVTIQPANDRIVILYSEQFTTGTRLKFLGAGPAGGHCDFQSGELIEEPTG
jgi:hypothetical protein